MKPTGHSLRLIPVLAATATLFLWAGAFPAVGIAVEHFEPLPLAALRFAISAPFCLGWLIARRPAWPQYTDLLRMAACGALGIALYNVLLATGQQSVSPGAASFIIATQPLFAGLLAVPLLGEHFGRRAWIGCGMALTGVAVISFPGATLQADAKGPLILLAAAVCSGTYFVLQKPLIARHGALTSAAATLLLGEILLLPWLPAGLAAAVTAPEAFGAVLFLGLGSGVAGYAFWMAALNGLGAGAAARFLFLMAPLATGLQMLVDGQPPAATTLAGGGLALAGVIHASRLSSPRRPTSST